MTPVARLRAHARRLQAWSTSLLALSAELDLAAEAPVDGAFRARIEGLQVEAAHAAAACARHARAVDGAAAAAEAATPVFGPHLDAWAARHPSWAQALLQACPICAVPAGSYCDLSIFPSATTPSSGTALGAVHRGRHSSLDS